MQFQKEGQPAFQAETGNDNPDGSSPKTNETDQTQSSGGESKPDATKDGGSESKNLNTPPAERWVERENDWKKRFNDQEVRHTSELTKLREDFDQRFAKVSPKETGESPEIPQWFGGEEEAWKQYEIHTQRLIEQAIKQATEKTLNTINERTAKEQKEIDEATKWFQDEVSAMESDKELNPQGLEIDRNKLLKITLDNKIVDPDTGKWNYRLAFKLMKPAEVFQVKKDLKERKNLASATISDDRINKPQAFKTSEDFKNPSVKPW